MRLLSMLKVCFIVDIWYRKVLVISFCNCCTSFRSFRRFWYSFFTSVIDSSSSITHTSSISSPGLARLFSTSLNLVWTVVRWVPALATYNQILRLFFNQTLLCTNHITVCSRWVKSCVVIISQDVRTEEHNRAYTHWQPHFPIALCPYENGHSTACWLFASRYRG